MCSRNVRLSGSAAARNVLVRRELGRLLRVQAEDLLEGAPEAAAALRTARRLQRRLRVLLRRVLDERERSPADRVLRLLKCA